MRAFKIKGISIAIIILLFVVSASCSSPSSITTTTSPPGLNTIKIANKPVTGDYLVDQNGFSLYYTTQDSPGVSNINDPGVLYSWPIFYTQNVIVPSQLNTIDFYSITKHDNRMQTAYRGWPLYYYLKDKAAGDVNGDGLNGIWFLARLSDFASLSTQYVTP